MINFRILRLVGFFLFIAYLGVTAVRSSSHLNVWQESIPPHGITTSESLPNGMTLVVTDSIVDISIPNCAVDSYPENFFLHVYPISSESHSDRFINMDFNLAHESAKKTTNHGVVICEYRKTFDHIKAREVVVGQFELNDGRCCNILWSRHFIPLLESGR